MANRTRYPRDPEKYPDEDKYPEIMSKMDPLIIRVSPTVLLVGSTTYTAKIKLGYRFNGFNVNVTGVGIPIYTEEVDIGNASTTNKCAKNGMSDAYNKVEEQATRWMDDLEKSMLDDSKEKNIVDLLREIKYQMHFDMSGHKYPAITPGTEEYDARMEVCDEVPTYITDIYKLLAEMNARLTNLATLFNSDGSPDPVTHKNDLITGVDVSYNDTKHGFDVAYSYEGDCHVESGLIDMIDKLYNCIGTGVDSSSLQARITKIQESIGTSTTNTVQKYLSDIHTDIDALKSQTETNTETISNRLAPTGYSIYSAVQVLVGEMQAVNGKIGTVTDHNIGTIFSYLNLFNETSLPNIQNSIGTLQDSVNSVSNSVSNLPTFISAHSNTLTHLGDALIEGASGIDYHSLQGFGGWAQSWSIRVYMGTWHN